MMASRPQQFSALPTSRNVKVRVQSAAGVRQSRYRSHVQGGRVGRLRLQRALTIIGIPQGRADAQE